jgi:hypothetical protein
MNWQVLLSGTPIGEAEALHTFVYYDGPRLQSIRNKAGQTFLAFWLDDLDGHVEVWALVPLSLGRYNEALRGEHDLYRLLTQPEDNYVYRVRIKAKTNTASVEIVRPEAFSDDVLPARGAVLPALDPHPVSSRRTSTSDAASLVFERIPLPTATSQRTSAAELAAKLKREVLLMALSTEQADGNEASASLVASMIERVQGAVTGLARTYGKAQLNIVGTYAGSFGVQFASAVRTDLYGNSKVAKGISSLITISESLGNEQTLRDHFDELTGRAARRYRRFLETLEQQEASAVLDWGSPNRRHNVRSAVVTPAMARTAIKHFETWAEVGTRTFEVTGVVTGVNLRLRRFELWDDDDAYIAEIADSAMDAAAHVVISAYHRATIEEIVTYSTAGRSRRKNRLISLSTVREITDDSESDAKDER